MGVDQVRHPPDLYETSCTTPPLVVVSISRSGRSTASSTRRSGLLNPALVQSSAGSSGWPLAQVGLGRGAAAAAHEPEKRGQAADDDEEPDRRQVARPWQLEPGPNRGRRRSRARVQER